MPTRPLNLKAVQMIAEGLLSEMEALVVANYAKQDVLMGAILAVAARSNYDGVRPESVVAKLAQALAEGGASPPASGAPPRHRRFGVVDGGKPFGGRGKRRR